MTPPSVPGSTTNKPVHSRRAPYDETAAAAATIMHRRYAPNHKLTEPWRFVCLGDESV
eukprot:COSAG02_NODE_33166_length_504_cov_0.997531_2_plen_57_part_01